MSSYLDWTDDAEEVLAQHYSSDVLVLDFAMLDPLPPEEPAEEFAIVYEAGPQHVTAAGLRVQELPPVVTLATAEHMCRIHGLGSDLLDARTFKLCHRLDTRGLLIPVTKEGT